MCGFAETATVPSDSYPSLWDIRHSYKNRKISRGRTFGLGDAGKLIKPINLIGVDDEQPSELDSSFFCSFSNQIRRLFGSQRHLFSRKTTLTLFSCFQNIKGTFPIHKAYSKSPYFSNTPFRSVIKMYTLENVISFSHIIIVSLQVLVVTFHQLLQPLRT